MEKYDTMGPSRESEKGLDYIHLNKSSIRIDLIELQECTNIYNIYQLFP